MIDETGEQVGIISLEKALQMAEERNLDLIQITDKTTPPVCKISDYGKYLYREEKKQRHEKKQKHNELKGIRLGFNISSHDMETRAKAAEKFLKEGDKVRIEMKLRGRERALQNHAKEKIEDFLKILFDLIPCKIEQELKRKPRGLTMIISKKDD